MCKRTAYFVCLLLFTCLFWFSSTSPVITNEEKWCARAVGASYNVIGWPGDTVVWKCCYSQELQNYERSIQGINHEIYYTSDPCNAEAPCEGVRYEAKFGDPLAKFALRFVVTDGNYQGCPTAPVTRWQNLPDNGGLIFANWFIYLFEDAGML